MSAEERVQNFNNLVSQRDLLESEAAAIADDLNSPGPNGEPPAGIKSPLVDKDGFPRGDIDVYSVVAKRNRLSVINTDHKLLMKTIENEMKEIFDLQLHLKTVFDSAIAKVSNEAPKLSELKPMAKINEICEGSPAFVAGLENEDLLLSFGDVTSETGSPLASIPDVVRRHVNLPVKLIIKRNGQIFSKEIIPKSWGGRGLLGLHLSPL